MVTVQERNIDKIRSIFRDVQMNKTKISYRDPRERRDKNKDDTGIDVYNSGRPAHAAQTRQPSNRRETKYESAVTARRIVQSAPLVSSKGMDSCQRPVR